jgi:tetratricopeptide (TPR) repeat protein
MTRSRLGEAFAHLSKALKVAPDFLAAQVDLAAAEKLRGHYQEASHLLEAHFNLGGALTSAGHGDEAVAEFQWILAAKPGDPAASAAPESLHLKR